MFRSNNWRLPDLSRSVAAFKDPYIQQGPPIVAMPSSRKRRFVQKTPDEEETKTFKVLLERLKNMTPSRLPPSEDREPGMDHEHENERFLPSS